MTVHDALFCSSTPFVQFLDGGSREAKVIYSQPKEGLYAMAKCSKYIEMFALD